MEPSLKQRLVGVDVAHAGDHTLIEQHRLETALGSTQRLAPIPRAEIERFRSQPRLLEEALQFRPIRKQRGTAEAADIAEAQLVAAAFQVDPQVGMIRHRRIRGHHGELSRHPQMDDEEALTLKRNHDPFAAATDLIDAPAGQQLGPRTSTRAAGDYAG